ncbi:hypothetical protein [Roseovarius phycicola]|uniref:Secreted protein n=1 Tax=Roseovarius phycicola TaxID=3080976 RepID=A0ABZ2HGS1_9RHOB
MKRLLIGLTATLLAAGPLTAQAAECLATFQIETEADHGTLPSGSILQGEIAYSEGRALRMGNETVSYLSTGTIRVVALDGSSVSGVVRAVHMVRTPHFADYASFDAKNVDGNLGGISAYEDPLLITLFAPRGSLESFDLPKDTEGWTALSRRQVFQVHTPDTMWTLPGRVFDFEVMCE